MKKNSLFFFFLYLVTTSFTQSTNYNIINFGAIGDGKSLNTQSIQKAIDSCAANGGGNVVIPAGEFVSGVFQLKTNVTLYLDNGAVLKASPNLDDYVLNGVRVGLIFTKNCENVMIKGDGIIDLNGDKFNYMDKRKTFKPDEYKKYTRQGMSYAGESNEVSDGPAEPHEQRPYQLIIFSNCKNVRVTDVTIKNAPFWTLHLADCDRVVINNVRILNDVLVANSDGIDCTSCSNVIISNCEIIGGDDAIVLNSYSVHFELPGFQNLKRPSENIIVSNCILMSRSSGIRIGGIDHNYMKNYSFSNIIIYSSNRGIGLFTGIEGGIENCSFSDITIETRLHTGDWWGKAEPIHISAYPTSASNNVGKIKNIRFRNIKAISENGIIIYGFEKGIISDIMFDGLDLFIKNGPLQKTYGGNFDLRPVRDASMSLFNHDIPGIFIKNANGINIINSRITFENNMEDFFRYGIWAEDFQNLSISGLVAAPPPATKDILFYLDNGSDFSLMNSFIDAPEKSFLRKKNLKGSFILTNNHFRK
jgi:hypothetical protein